MTTGGSNLTKSERDVLAQGLDDLAVGYPEIPLPPWQHALWYECSLQDIANAYGKLLPHVTTRAFESLPSPYQLELEFLTAALRVLRLAPESAGNAVATTSGSLALALAIEAAVPRRAEVLTQEPVFDVVRALLRDREARCQTIGVDWKAARFLRPIEVHQTVPADAVVLVSPDNPSGAVVDEAVLSDLREHGVIGPATVIVIDHAFQLVASANQRFSGRAIDLLTGTGSPWIMVWDTGKTFDLDDEKLGVVVTSDATLADRVRAASSRYQCTLPRRTLMQLTLMLDRAEQERYLDWLWDLREANAAQLRQLAERCPATDVTIGPAGAFGLINCGGRDVAGIISEAAQRGLGLVSTRSFCADSRDPRSDLLRIPLLRGTDMMASALDRLARILVSS